MISKATFETFPGNLRCMWIENRKNPLRFVITKTKIAPSLLKKNPEKKSLEILKKPGPKRVGLSKKNPWQVADEEFLGFFWLGVDPSPAGWSSYPYGQLPRPPTFVRLQKLSQRAPETWGRSLGLQTANVEHVAVVRFFLGGGTPKKRPLKQKNFWDDFCLVCLK